MSASPDRDQRLHGAAYGIAAAMLFGASAPLAKLLLEGLGPVLLAGLLYLGGGVGLSIIRILFPGVAGGRGEARLRRTDLPLVAGIVVLGGGIGPVLLLVGLTRLSAFPGTLLLNLEAPFTILLAVLLFREHLDRREAAAAAVIVVGAALVGLRPGAMGGDPLGVLAVAGACLCWGLDNNLSQRLSVRDPVAVARIKTLAAGGANLLLGLAIERVIPPPRYLLPALVVGTVSYGVSLVLDLHALRVLGAAREAAWFATAPFAGAVLSVLLLGERPSAADGFAVLLMASGVALLARARHHHVHTHEALVHDHLHVHDEHHRHAHERPVSQPHAHPHRHEAETHEHLHVSDEHHRHRH